MQVVINTLRILEEVAVRQPIGVSELARVMSLPKSTVHRGLRALEAAGWIGSDGDEPPRWILRTKALDVGRHVVEGLGMRQKTMRAMERLRQVTEETIHLAVLENAKMVIVDRVDSPKPVRSFYPLGYTLPVHAASTGKAILAWLPSSEVDALLDGGLPRFTKTTVTDRKRLLGELDDVRRLGYATNRGELRADIGSVAAAILDSRGRPVAAMSISAPIQRMPESLQPQLGRLVAEAVAEVMVP
jgi:IclR family acetate operon transcriptional repressor